MKLDWARNFVDDNAKANTYLYALIRVNEPNTACALLDISYAMPGHEGAWLKVLSIQVEPNLDATLNPQPKELAMVASTALIESLGLPFVDYPCHKLKVFGTTPLTIDFIEGVAVSLPGVEGITISKHGSWLILDR